MKYFLGIACAVLLAINACQSEHVHYDGYKVFRVEFNTDEQFNMLYQMDLNSPDVSFWQLSHAEHYADIMVAPAKIPHFLETMAKYSFKYEVQIEDVEKLIADEQQNN